MVVDFSVEGFFTVSIAFRLTVDLDFCELRTSGWVTL